MKKLTALTLAMVVAFAAVPTQAGLPGLPGKLGDKVDKATGMDKCKDGDDSCKAKAKAKEIAGAAAIGLAAKLIVDMVIDAKAKQVNDEGQVVAEYKKEFKTLPAQSTARQYDVSFDPGDVVKPASAVKVKSQITVVPGIDISELLVAERMTIYDNEDKTKSLRASTKQLNENTKRAGRFTNEFSFTLPKDLPQGVYPIGNELLIDGKVVQNNKKDLQLVMVVDDSGIRLASAQH